VSLAWFGGQLLLGSCHIHSRRFDFSKRAAKSTRCCSWPSLDSLITGPRCLQNTEHLLMLSCSSTTTFPGNGWSLLPSASPRHPSPIRVLSPASQRGCSDYFVLLRAGVAGEMHGHCMQGHYPADGGGSFQARKTTSFSRVLAHMIGVSFRVSLGTSFLEEKPLSRRLWMPGQICPVQMAPVILTPESWKPFPQEKLRQLRQVSSNTFALPLGCPLLHRQGTLLLQVHASLSPRAALPGPVLLGTSLCPQALFAVGCIQLTASGGTPFLISGFWCRGKSSDLGRSLLNPNAAYLRDAGASGQQVLLPRIRITKLLGKVLQKVLPSFPAYWRVWCWLGTRCWEGLNPVYWWLHMEGDTVSSGGPYQWALLQHHGKTSWCLNFLLMLKACHLFMKISGGKTSSTFK